MPFVCAKATSRNKTQTCCSAGKKHGPKSKASANYTRATRAGVSYRPVISRVDAFSSPSAPGISKGTFWKVNRSNWRDYRSGAMANRRDSIDSIDMIRCRSRRLSGISSAIERVVLFTRLPSSTKRAHGRCFVSWCNRRIYFSFGQTRRCACMCL